MDPAIVLAPDGAHDAAYDSGLLDLSSQVMASWTCSMALPIHSSLALGGRPPDRRSRASSSTRPATVPTPFSASFHTRSSGS
jgi:hypothetical protein